MSDWPKIVSRQTNKVSPWMDIIARKVEFAPGAASEIYHAVGQQDYIAIVALTPDGKIPIVRQYRPALERLAVSPVCKALLPAPACPASAATR